MAYHTDTLRFKTLSEMMRLYVGGTDTNWRNNGPLHLNPNMDWILGKTIPTSVWSGEKQESITIKSADNPSGSNWSYHPSWIRSNPLLVIGEKVRIDPDGTYNSTEQYTKKLVGTIDKCNEISTGTNYHVVWSDGSEGYYNFNHLILVESLGDQAPLPKQDAPAPKKETVLVRVKDLNSLGEKRPGDWNSEGQMDGLMGACVRVDKKDLDLGGDIHITLSILAPRKSGFPWSIKLKDVFESIDLQVGDVVEMQKDRVGSHSFPGTRIVAQVFPDKKMVDFGDGTLLYPYDCLRLVSRPAVVKEVEIPKPDVSKIPYKPGDTVKSVSNYAVGKVGTVVETIDESLDTINVIVVFPRDSGIGTHKRWMKPEWLIPWVEPVPKELLGFKVGDRVKVTCGMGAGQDGIIVEIDESLIPFKVQFNPDNPSDYLWKYAQNLTHFKPDTRDGYEMHRDHMADVPVPSGSFKSPTIYYGTPGGETEKIKVGDIVKVKDSRIHPGSFTGTRTVVGVDGNIIYLDGAPGYMFTADYLEVVRKPFETPCAVPGKSWTASASEYSSEHISIKVETEIKLQF